MSGHIPRSSQTPSQYSAYPERPSSRQGNTQGNYMQRPPSRSDGLYGMPQSSLSRSGHRAPTAELTHVRQLPPVEQERFLREHDPMRYMRNLNANTSLYRSTEHRYVSNGRITGNPESMARIVRHDKLVPNQSSRFYADARIGTAEAYSPAPARARDLGPTLNVMAGSQAHTFAAMYGGRNPGNVVVKMKLGDFLQRGGQVYFDVGSAITGDRDTAPLIVTLPRGESVPVQIVQ